MNAVATHLKSKYLSDYGMDAAALLKSADVTDLLAGIPGRSLANLAENAEPELSIRIFRMLDLRAKQELLQLVSTRILLQVLGGLDEDEREDFFAEIPTGLRDEFEKQMSFPESQAGHYMEQVIARFTPEDTIEESLSKLRGTSAHRTRSIYVVDNKGALVGRVDMQDIALAEPGTILEELLHPVEGFGYLTTPRDELLEIFSDHRVDSIPLVDQEHHLAGVVRYTSLFHAAEESFTSDMQMMVGVSPEERALSSPWFSVSKRLPWLHINLLTAFLAAAVVGIFESTIAQFTALAILLPVVAGQSGNAGSQALAVTMRGLALREISILSWRKVLAKEVQVGVVDGIALAITCGAGVYLWSQSWGLALVIGIAMIISMIAAGISGALVPMILIRLGQDPATASSIILTTVTDVAGFISFLGTATLLIAIL